MGEEDWDSERRLEKRMQAQHDEHVRLVKTIEEINAQRFAEIEERVERHHAENNAANARMIQEMSQAFEFLQAREMEQRSKEAEHAWISFACNAMKGLVWESETDASGGKAEKVVADRARAYADVMLIVWQERWGKKDPK